MRQMREKYPESPYVLDDRERRILAQLQVDGRVPHAELARRIGLSPTAVSDRVSALESAGVIRGYAARVSPAHVGLPIVAFVTMTCDGDRCRRLAIDVAGLPEVIECHRLTGDASALLKVAVASIAALEALADRLSTYGKPSTAIVLSTPLDGRPLPTGMSQKGVVTSRRRKKPRPPARNGLTGHSRP